VALRAVTRRFGDQVVLDRFTLELADGSVTALTGANGVGKTTVGRLVLGLDTPDAGQIEGLAGRRRAAVFQENRLCEHLSAVGNVRLVLPRSAWDRPEADLRALGLDDTALGKPVSELSGGQRRRVAMARALVNGADLVVLDEPTTGVDAESKPAIMRFLAERLSGCTVLLITHDAAEAECLGARVVVL
jgi:NitT/TauT family transport system ATP-binding protein